VEAPPAAAVGPVESAPAVPMTADEKLLAALKAHNISAKKPEDATTNAPIICENLTDGTMSWSAELDAVRQAAPGLTASDADEYMHLVVQFYCPPKDPSDMTTDEKFIAALAANSVDVVQKDAAVRNAHLVCQNIQDGQNWEQVARDLRERAIGYTKANADTFVNAAIQFYCPQH
jgi:hypothetical protein